MMCIRSACAVQHTEKEKISLSFRGRALMRKTGLACIQTRIPGAATMYTLGIENRCGYAEHFLCRPAPSIINQSIPPCLPACLSRAEINSKMKRCILSCQSPYCGLQRPESKSYFIIITARGVMRCVFVHRPACQPVTWPAGGLLLLRLGNKVSV